MVKCSHPGESGEISRELLLQGHCSSFSSFQRLGHTKQISTVTVSAVSHASVLSPQIQTSNISEHSEQKWFIDDFQKKYLRSVIRKVQEQYCGFIMKKLNLTKVVSSVAEGAGISFKMDRDRGKWWKQNKKQFNLLFGLLYNIHHISVYSSKNNHSLSKCLLIGGYTQLQDLSDVQDDMSDVFRTTIIKIKGDAIKTSDKI